MIYDISPDITEQLAVWPGDSPPSREVLLDMANGDNITLSTLRATVHLGSHADAPSHYGVDAPTIERQPLDLYVGTCQVLHVSAAPDTRIGVDVLPEKLGAPRLLIASGTYPDPNQFNQNFAALKPGFVEEISRRGVRLVGVDTPSVDLFSSRDLPAHQACLQNGVSILEGLRLADVPDGLYELIALPLKLVGFDASPVRAILRTIGSQPH
ncbi:MAG TPA: cyclase family protein [Phycisphaerae bacterium]|nr:cyclase family protein [Phycisphaerae bacterium]